MLAVQLTPRKKVFVNFVEDTFPNKGGYFCEVFADKDMEFKLDSFTIQRQRLIGSQSDKLKKAYLIANNIVKTRF